MYPKLKAYIEKRGHSFINELWEEVKVHSKPMTIKKNEVLIEIGSLHKYAYFVTSGSFVTSIISNSGDKKAVWFHFDELFTVASCIDSYFLNETTKYEIKALEDSEVIKFHKSIVDSWVINHPSFTQFYIRDIISDSIAVNEIRAYQLSHSPLQLLEYIHNKYPIFIERLSSKNMAHFLGITPEWYSKLKKKIQS